MNEEGVTFRTIGENLRTQINQGGIHLLSELNLDQEEIEFIRSNAGRLINSAVSGSKMFDIQTAYLMMDIGMRFYNDGTYWVNFWKQVNMPAKTNDQTILGEFFNNTIAKYNLAVVETTGRKYVNMILMHAFIPEMYGDAFFNFVQKYYKIVLKGTVPDDLDSKLGLFEEVFRSEEVANSYPELKNVQLIVSTKLALSNRAYCASILTKIIKRMANEYGSDDDVRLGVYEIQFKNWTQREKKKGKSNSDINSPPTLRYNLNNNDIYVSIPPQILNQKDGLTCTVESFKGEILKKFSMTSYTQFHNLISDTIEFKMFWNPLDRFRIRIGERVIFENVNQGVLLFDKRGQKKSNVSLGFNIAIISKEGHIDVQTSDLAEGDEYVAKGFLMTRGSKVCISGQIYIIEEEILDSLHIISDPVDIDCNDQDGNSYNVYSKHPTLRVTLTPEHGARLKLSIGRMSNRVTYDTPQDLIDDPKIVRDGEFNYVIDLSKKNLMRLNGIYTIRYRGRDVHRYVLLDGFGYRFEKELYELDEESKLFHKGSSEGIVFNTTQGTVALPDMAVDGRTMSFIVQVPSRRFSFDKITWMLFNSSELYFRDIEKRQLYVYCPTLVFPLIIVNYKKSVPLKLEIEGPYLTCEFKKVVQIGYILEHARVYKPTMSFKCGRFDLFTIRYTADYEFKLKSIVQSNAPDKINAICEYSSGEIVDFAKGRAPILQDYMGDINVFEYYDDGFGEQKRFAFKLGVGIELITEIDAILNAECQAVKIKYNGNVIEYENGRIGHMVDMSKSFIIFEHEFIRKLFLKDEGGESSLKIFDATCKLIKDVMLKDSSTEHLKRRIKKFKKYDVDFAIKLCERALEIRSDREVINQLEELKKLEKN